MVNPVWTVTEAEMVVQDEMETEAKEAIRVIQEKMVKTELMESAVHQVHVVGMDQMVTLDHGDHPEQAAKAEKENQVIKEIVVNQDKKVHVVKMVLMGNLVAQVVAENQVEPV